MEIESPFDKGNITTVKLKSKTKLRLDHLRVYRRETYDEILEKILDVLNLCRLNPESARAKLIAIDKAKRKGAKQMPMLQAQNQIKNIRVGGK